jgi:hypothetical protein
MKKLLMAIAFLLLPVLANAQITPPYTFTAGTPILSSQVNANFAKFADALNRTGGTITGNITVAAGVTIDGVDISDLSNPATFEAVNGGTVSAVPFGFADDPGTGMWSSANDRLDWALNEVTYMYLTTSGLNVTGGGTFSGNLTIGASKFTVAASDGDTVILGDLNVGGTITGTATAFSGSLSGDVTSTGMATTLATVNANVGTFGGATTIPVVTVNAKGLVTAVSTASVSAGSTLPADMVAFFASTCPAGWTEYTTARGRYLVAMPSGGTLLGTVGSAMTDLEARAAGAHTHGGGALGVSITDAGHTHSGGQLVAGSSGDSASGAGGDWIDTLANVGTATTGITADVTGSTDSAGTSTTPAPYIQLYACIKT